jgi:hypothetical protein
MASSDRQKGFVGCACSTPPRPGAAGKPQPAIPTRAVAPDQIQHEKAAPPEGSAAMRFVKPWTYLVSLAASGFAIFFVLCFFFIALACAFRGSLAFTVGCVAGPVVWAEATDTLPTRAAQHAATIRFRILISRLVKKERLITGHSRKGSMLGTAGDFAIERTRRE